MKILAYVDTHGSLTAYSKLKKLIKKEKPELIICAGDITIFGANIDYFIHQIDRFHIPSLFIHGNHETEAEMKSACSFFKHTNFIHKKIYEKNEYIFIGYGGGGFSLRDKEFEKWTTKIKDKIKDKKVILVLHGPPYGTKLDDVIDAHCGNKSYTKFIEQEQPKLVICGHIHENERKTDYIKKSKVINPGPFGKGINI